MSHLAHKTICLLGFCIANLACQLATAQVPAPAGGGSAPIVRDLWFDGIITLVMVGAALFVICRTSNRS